MNEDIFIIFFFQKFRVDLLQFFFRSFWLIFYPLNPDPWIHIFLLIRVQEAKILRIRILITAFPPQVDPITNSAQDPDQLEPQNFGFQDPDPPKICGSTEQNINQKLKNYFFTLYTQIWTIEKREIIKISWFLNGSSFSIN